MLAATMTAGKCPSEVFESDLGRPPAHKDVILRSVSVLPNEPEWFRFRFISSSRQSVQARVQHQIQLLADVFGEEPQDEVAVLLKELILSPVAAVGGRIREVLRAIEFYRDACILTEQVNFERPKSIERDR